MACRRPSSTGQSRKRGDAKTRARNIYRAPSFSLRRLEPPSFYSAIPISLFLLPTDTPCSVTSTAHRYIIIPLIFNLSGRSNASAFTSLLLAARQSPSGRDPGAKTCFYCLIPHRSYRSRRSKPVHSSIIKALALPFSALLGRPNYTIRCRPGPLRTSRKSLNRSINLLPTIRPFPVDFKTSGKEGNSVLVEIQIGREESRGIR